MFGEEGVGGVNDEDWFIFDGGRLFLIRVLTDKPSRIGSCCVRAVVRVKRGGSSVTEVVSASQKEFTNGSGVAVQARTLH